MNGLYQEIFWTKIPSTKDFTGQLHRAFHMKNIIQKVFVQIRRYNIFSRCDGMYYRSWANEQWLFATETGERLTRPYRW